MLSKSLRNLRSGFTLLEVLLAFAILNFSLVTLFTIATRTTSAAAQARAELENAQFARSVLEEYVTTYPLLTTEGEYAGRWSWEISETQQPPIEENAQNEVFRLIRVTVMVRPPNSSGPDYELSTVVARRSDR